MPNSTRFLTFDTQEDDVVRAWHPKAYACDPGTLDDLAQQFDAQKGHDANATVMGFTVRARHKDTAGEWEVVEFSYPIDFMHRTATDPGQLVDGDNFRQIIRHFHAYLASLEDIHHPSVDVLVYERHGLAADPQDPIDRDVVAKVRAAHAHMSVTDLLQHSIDPLSALDGLPVIGVGGVAGRVVTQGHEGACVVLDPGMMMGHLMEMVLTPEGEDVRLHPLLDTLGLNFKRHKLTKSVINPHYPVERDEPELVAPRQKI